MSGHNEQQLWFAHVPGIRPKSTPLHPGRLCPSPSQLRAAPKLILDAHVPTFKMFHPSSNTARTHAHTSISMLKSLVNFCSRDFLFHKKFDDSTLAKRHIVVGHFVKSDTGHVMQAIDVARHSRITQQLVPSTTILSFVCCSQFACKKMLLMTFGTTLVQNLIKCTER